MSARESILMSRADAAVMLAVSTRTIDRWQLAGVLPRNSRVMIGGVRRYRRDVLDEWIRSGCPTGTSDPPREPGTLGEQLDAIDRHLDDETGGDAQARWDRARAEAAERWRPGR